MRFLLSFLFHFRAQEGKSTDCRLNQIYEGLHWLVAFARLTVNLFSLTLTEILQTSNHCHIMVIKKLKIILNTVKNNSGIKKRQGYTD